MRKFVDVTQERERGFTLIELLVVIIIIGILAAIAIPVFLNQRKKGVDAGLKADLKSAATAAESVTAEDPSATAFGANTTAVRQAMIRGGFKLTTGNVVVVAGGPAGGYCLRAYNAAGSADGPTNAFWYDSETGGLRAGGPADYPTTGRCTNAAVTAAGGWSGALA